jgi:hypothetical protein
VRKLAPSGCNMLLGRYDGGRSDAFAWCYLSYAVWEFFFLAERNQASSIMYLTDPHFFIVGILPSNREIKF